MAARPKISRGGYFRKIFRPGGIPKIPPYPPIPVACLLPLMQSIIQGWLKSAILGGGSSYKDLGLSLGGGSSYKEINPVPEAARNRI